MPEALPEASPVAVDLGFDGDRQAVDQPTGGLSGLTLATTRADVLHGVLLAQRADARRRYDRLATLHPPADEVLFTGGNAAVARLLHAAWPGRHTYRQVEEGTLRGLGALV